MINPPTLAGMYKSTNENGYCHGDAEDAARHMPGAAGGAVTPRHVGDGDLAGVRYALGKALHVRLNVALGGVTVVEETHCEPRTIVQRAP